MTQAFSAQAQAFPTKAVRIVVPFPPAGGADTLARVMAPQLSALWGQQVIIENKPGKLSFGSSGNGAASHLTAELFKAQAGVDLLHVPYKGTGQALTDLVSGQVSLMFAPAQTVMQHVQAGRLKALAVTSSKRSEILPTIPTVAESGVPSYAAVGWFGLLAPAATSKAIVNKISTDTAKVLAQKETKDKLLALGSEPESSSPEAFSAFIKEDQAKWAKLMREQGIKAK